MKRKIATLVAVAGIALGAAAVPAAAAGNGYGKDIKDGCGATYGQLVSSARQAGHITGGVNGAQNWVTSGLGTAHGCA